MDAETPVNLDFSPLKVATASSSLTQSHLLAPESATSKSPQAPLMGGGEVFWHSLSWPCTFDVINIINS